MQGGELPPMHPYVLLLCLTCLVAAASAGFTLQSESFQRAARFAAALLIGAAYWAICEVLWNLAPDAEGALRGMRLSAPGWCFIGPLVLSLFLSVSPAPWPRLRLLCRTLWGLCSGFLVATLSTDWMFRGVVQTSWGWSYETGPLHPFFYGATLAGVVPAIVVIRHLFEQSFSPAERRQRPWILAGIGVPLVVASLTEAILPTLGHHVPRLGTASFAALGIISVWNMQRFGYSFLTPGSFAREIVETLTDGVVLLSWNERIRTANEGITRLSGHPREVLEGMPIGELLSWSFGALEEEDADEVECELSRHNGARIPVTVASSILHDRQGHPVGLVLVVRDLREVADLRTRLIRAARLAAVGELAAGIAHEINNPLAFIRANLSQLGSHWKLLCGELEPEIQARQLEAVAQESFEMLEESLEGVDRAAEIVRGVRGFSHAGGGAREHIDLNALLNEVLHMADAELRGRARVERDYQSLPRVLCAPQELKQVFLNLLINAGHAIGDGGRIRVETRATANEVCVHVEDDGCGIPPEIIDRIFDPFFTTKCIGEGTGLGLGIAYRIVRSHDGDLRVESEPGHGARFSVRLPASPSSARSDAP